MSSKAKASNLLDIRLFGRVKVAVQGRDVTPLLSRRSGLLLGILALRQGRPIERWRLAGMLWPDSPDETALHNLRQTLSPLRTALGPAKDLIKNVSPRSIMLDLSPDIHIDVSEFDKACDQATLGSWERAVELYNEPLLSEHDEPFAVSEREIRSNAFLDATDQLAHHHSALKDFGAVLPVVRKALNENAYYEPACRQMMSALAGSGQTAAALDFCREFRHRLRQDLRTDIGPETRALYRSIRSSGGNIAAPQPVVKKLPGVLPTLIGRETEIKQVASMLERCRLVTLTGAGGVGKTRLALAVADRIARDYMDGAYFVDLAPVREAQMIAKVIADRLDIAEAPSQAIIDTVLARVRDRELLLLVDNCEHIANDVAEFLEKLLSLAPGVRVLATSRQTLGVSGELVWRVPSLSLPDEQLKVDLIAQSDAVRLFLERCSEDSRNDIATIGWICRRLDGLPLAIELAAARTKVLSVAEIRSKLTDRFALLTGGNRTLARHQTLHASIEWSWDMLSDQERQLLMRLSVFRGGCTLEAAEAVAEDLQLRSVLDSISSLVDRSLVNVVRAKGASRYTLLETIREFAAEQLEDSGDLKSTLDRHQQYFVRLAVDGAPSMGTPDETALFKKYDVDHDNIRAALDRCYDIRDYDTALEMARALCRFWDTCGHLEEGRRQIEKALSFDTPRLGALFRAGAHTHAGWIATVQFDNDAAIKHYEIALSVFRAPENLIDIGKAQMCLGNAKLNARDYEGAKVAYLKALEIGNDLQPGVRQIGTLGNLAELALEQDLIDEARAFIEETFPDLPSARKRSPEVCGLILCCLSYIHFREGNHNAALLNALDALELFTNSSLNVDVPRAVDLIAMANSGLGQIETAVTLFAAAENLVNIYGAPLNDFLTRSHAIALSQAKSAIGLSRSGELTLKGKAMSIEECTAFCREHAAGNRALEIGHVPGIPRSAIQMK